MVRFWCFALVVCELEKFDMRTFFFFFAGKKSCVVLDFVDNLKDASHLATVATLMGLPAEFVFDGKVLRSFPKSNFFVRSY